MDLENDTLKTEFKDSGEKLPVPLASLTDKAIEYLEYYAAGARLRRNDKVMGRIRC